MALFRRGETWWYKFYFAGRLIRESSKSTSKALARVAERQRRRELESEFHNIGKIREQRIRSLKEIIDDYLEGYRLRYRAPRFRTSETLGSDPTRDHAKGGLEQHFGLRGALH